ncbi:Mur ligase family protein [Parvularcula maris]|uniref:Mur ligase family protein n=1 Tax=Parvularcula maris TaxID=2965077 RepID=A0A9X2L9X2_9PROT|nr:Mur ligase family protein [Parvularcula maris]MCQ8185813.1 Mur ligase family protein [Parvularcula maris]
MAEPRYFFCGIGGSGMLPLARFLHARGAVVEGSDRAVDQGRADGLRTKLKGLGITVHPQDGSGITGGEVLVTSSAVEATIPDVAAAVEKGSRRMIRAELLASLANSAEVSCGVAGTSGKSTTTAMLAHILAEIGADPAVVNGAPMLNIEDMDGSPAAFREGDGPFVCEVDESDGSIALYNPSVGVLLNVSEDHKPMPELMKLFGGYAERAGKVVLGVGSDPVRTIAKELPTDKVVTVGQEADADLSAAGVEASTDGLRGMLKDRGGGYEAELFLPLMGRFNIDNALAALAAAQLLGAEIERSVDALRTFKGSARRLQRIGTGGGVTVIDDFAHNPEKIAGSLGALTAASDRIHVYYQPHGYGPLRSGLDLWENAFASGLRQGDHLFISKPAYFGGTVETHDHAERLVAALEKRGLNAHYTEERSAFADHVEKAEEGDLVVVMGARDDSLTTFAHDLLAKLAQR